jgi:hypothetical protein
MRTEFIPGASDHFSGVQLDDAMRVLKIAKQGVAHGLSGRDAVVVDIGGFHTCLLDGELKVERKCSARPDWL